MNIFYLDSDPKLAAKFHCDKHQKMILESAQLLSTAHRETGSPWADQVYKSTHKQHPSSLWTRASHDHYSWLFELFRELTNEFYNRRGKVHGSWTKLGHILCHNPPGLPCAGFEPPPLCMPDQYKQEDAVEAYRAYYKGDKASFAKWEWPTAQTPSWWNFPKFSQDGA